VVAAGTSPLTYQWMLNGTNLPLQTNINLIVTAQSNTWGSYCVVVSNPYGQTYSAAATLNPPLRFLSPALSGGNGLSLLLTDSDGSPVASSRAFRVQIYATTNVTLPFSQWMPLTNQVIPAGGLLDVNGLTTANRFTLFFRAVEIP
jgi:hypothetical protein